MLHFVNDYSEGAHEKILARLLETNMEQTSGYGADPYTASATEKIRVAFDAPQADVWLLTGGTQTNQVIISSMLANYEGVVAADTGHVSVHEAGAIEYSGHKVLTIPAQDGKMKPEALSQYLADFYADGNYEHMVFPGMVYISHPTEYGSLYSKEELSQLSLICRAYEIPLFLDGARLGYALACPESDVTAKDIASLTDVFYIGGTKVGALFGEAVVFPGGNAPKHFMTHMKQHGALLAKGRILGLQFDTLFTDGLYLEISRNAIEKAAQIRNCLKENGYQLYIENPTNQIMIVMANDKYARLEESVAVSFMEKYDDSHTVIRICTSWATTQENTDALCEILRKLA